MTRSQLRALVDGRSTLVQIDRERITLTPEVAEVGGDRTARTDTARADAAEHEAVSREAASHEAVARDVGAHAGDSARDGSRAGDGGGDDVPAASGDRTAPRTFVVTPYDAVAARVQEDGTARALEVYTSVENGVAWAFVDGELFRIELDDADRVTRRRGAGDEALAAPMPATVIKLLVEAGAAVAAGDALLLLEAMKMDLPIRAPRAGRVKAFRCQAGELVQAGVPLVELEPA